VRFVGVQVKVYYADLLLKHSSCFENFQTILDMKCNICLVQSFNMTWQDELPSPTLPVK
jgi:hypothetical protein